MNLIIYLWLFLLIFFSALFSGLTLGLFSLDTTELERKKELGDIRAEKVYRVRNRGNLLLVSLLLGNVAVNSIISIMLGNVAGGVFAAIAATGLIVVFGEIIPQAAFARYALELGARTAWMVEVIIILFYPIAKPMAWILDKVLGEEMRTIWSKRELEHIIRMHEDDPRSEVDRDEERILLGALSFSEKHVDVIMTNRKDVYMLSKSTVLDQKTLYEIREICYTRIPIYSKNQDNIVGILYAKDLIGMAEGKLVKNLMRTHNLVRVSRKRRLDSLLNDMIKAHAHMALVTEKRGKFVGLVTMEDILEEIIGRDILDEDDG